MTKKSVLIIGDHPQSLAVVRALGAHNYGCILATDKNFSIANLSRFCLKKWHCPRISSAQFGLQLATFLKKHPNIVAIFPIGIEEIRATQKLDPKYTGELPIVSVSEQILETFHDKNLANTTAEQAGVKVPQSVNAENLDELRGAVDLVGYPIIIKSADNAGPVLGRKAYIVHSQDELAAAFSKWPTGHSQLQVQEYIVGKMQGADFGANNGKLIAYYQGAHGRTDSPDGTGMVVEFLPKAPCPKVLNMTQALVAHTNYSGPGLLQCIVSEKDGEAYFIEINPRLSAGCAEVILADLNLPLILLEAASTGKSEPINEIADITYNLNSRVHWLERDYLGFVSNFPRQRLQENLQALIALIKSSILCKSHINWRWHDPLPSLGIFYKYVHGVICNKLLMRRQTKATEHTTSKPAINAHKH